MYSFYDMIMFKCYNCGGCCEDVSTQISLTLGDIKRLREFTGKTAYKLYREGIIGIYPFGDPFKSDEFETEVGLFIPCRFRKKSSMSDKTINCSIYPARPINCRLFPYWILAEAPLNEIKQLIVPGHECINHININKEFKDDRKAYNDYKEKLVKILHEELRVTEPFYKELGLIKKIKTPASAGKDDDCKTIKKLIKTIGKQDFSKIFKRIDQKINNRQFFI
jgi:Fe-S-cluster containining protein